MGENKTVKEACGLILLILFLATAPNSVAQTEPSGAALAGTAATVSDSGTTGKTTPASAQNAAILKELEQMQARIAQLEAQLKAQGAMDPAKPAQDAVPAGALAASTAASGTMKVSAPPSAPAAQAGASGTPDSALDNLLRGTSVNFLFDGYYEYNFNAPIGRVNLLRAYDVSSNSFSINQADLILENAPDPAHGKRYGARIDLQYGQATQTLQGNPANEQRPDIYRALFQAYGTYVFPVGSGLRVDFGKWASALGYENNYTKDQNNYSRSYWFNFLPFYHMGLRTTYQVNRWLTANYWLVNGAQQTEDFNGFKDELFGVTLAPKPSISWTVNYYFGQEHADFAYVPGGTGLPVVQGEPFAPIPNPPAGKLHIFDSYASWNASPKLSLALEGDYVVQRLFTTSAPDHTDGDAAYVRYQLTPKFALASRAEYMSDRGGLFSGTTQALKEVTLTGQYQFAPGFLMFDEWRRDFSNRPYFLTDTLGALKNGQTTATVGLVWWFGPKTGSW